MRRKPISVPAPLIFIFALSCQAFAQTMVPRYSSLSANSPFARYSSPVALAILRFEGDAILDIKLFNMLKQDTVVLRKFTIFPYNVLQAQMNALGLTSLSPNDRQTLSQLKDQLNVSLVVTGKSVPNGFELRLVTTDGANAYVHSFLNTSSSSALSDAAKLFRDNVQTDYVNLGNIDWVQVDSGRFQMGSGEGYGDERPVHTVIVKSFYMSATEVTFDQYDAFCDATGRPRIEDNGWGRGKMPVSNVTWDDANAYCQWLSQQLGDAIRLPTEAEFEYAARGGDKSRNSKFSGSDYSDDVAWFIGNSKGEPHEVGNRMPNELGLHDMSGNVWEWCLDWYHTTYIGAPGDGTAWNVESMDTPYHVVRGGSWNSSSENCRVSVRNAGSASGWVNYAGFRLVKEIR